MEHKSDLAFQIERLENEVRILRERERRQRRFVDSLPVVAWSTDTQGKIDYVNPCWLEYTQLSFAEALEKGWQAIVAESDYPLFRVKFFDALEHSDTFEIECRLTNRLSNTTRWHLLSGVVERDENSTVMRWAGVATDINDERAAAETSRFLIALNDVLQLGLNYNDNLQKLSENLVPFLADLAVIEIENGEGFRERVAAYHRKPEVLKQLHSRNFLKSPTTQTDRGVNHVLKTGKAILIPEIRRLSLVNHIQDEELVSGIADLELYSTMILPLQARGRVFGALSLFSAESRRQYNESDLRLAEEVSRRASIAIDNARLFQETQEANRAKDEFLATLSHELRTPLSAIMGWTDFLLDGKPDEELLQEGLQALHRNAKAQSEIINDLLDVSRVITGKLRLEKADLDLNSIIVEAIESVHVAAAAKNIHIIKKLNDEIPNIFGDKTRLLQVFWNLLSNAVKFTPFGGEIRVESRAENGKASVSIRDSGIGIEQGFLPFVFQRFHQQDSSKTRRFGGLGLGLSIVRHLVEMHGGSVAVASEGKDKGSTFSVEFPVAERLSSAKTKGHSRRYINGTSNTSNSVPSEAKILVVDDSEDILYLLSYLLKKNGVQVVTAPSASHALELLQNETFDLLVSDIGMPQMDGFTFLKRLRADSRNRNHAIPAIALTAYVREEDKRDALAAGFQQHISKPVNPIELLSTLRSSLHHQHT